MVLVDKSVPTQHFYPDNNNKVVYSYSICKKDETRRWNEMRLTINNLNSVEEPKTTYLTSRPSREQRENEERIAMVMEYIHFIMPRIADKETVNHICAEVNNWMRLHSYKPKPIKGRLTKDISNIPLRHFVWNISERFMYKKYYTGDNRARFISTLFPREFADTDIATIKNFKVEPLKTLIPIDEPENGRLDFHYPADYVQEKRI